jgi:hypothetical protein
MESPNYQGTPMMNTTEVVTLASQLEVLIDQLRPKVAEYRLRCFAQHLAAEQARAVEILEAGDLDGDRHQFWVGRLDAIAELAFVLTEGRL